MLTHALPIRSIRPYIRFPSSRESDRYFESPTRKNRRPCTGKTESHNSVVAFMYTHRTENRIIRYFRASSCEDPRFSLAIKLLYLKLKAEIKQHNTSAVRKKTGANEKTLHLLHTYYLSHDNLCPCSRIFYFYLPRLLSNTNLKMKKSRARHRKSRIKRYAGQSDEINQSFLSTKTQTKIYSTLQYKIHDSRSLHTI